MHLVGGELRLKGHEQGAPLGIAVIGRQQLSSATLLNSAACGQHNKFLVAFSVMPNHVQDVTL